MKRKENKIGLDTNLVETSEISDDFTTFKNQTCVHSLFPGRLYCPYKKRVAMIGICEKCIDYSERNNEGN